MENNGINADRVLNEAFFERLSGLLDQHPEGLGEHAMLSGLRDDYFPFLGASPWQPHALFCAHFLLFHALYQLRDRAWQAASAHLDISPMRIRWLPYRRETSALAMPDSLRDYYLDLDNLVNTTEHDVEELLASFWVRFGALDQRAQALQELGLSDPVDDAAIKQAYRRLAMQHHPDRGGDTERLQAINAAVGILLKTY